MPMMVLITYDVNTETEARQEAPAASRQAMPELRSARAEFGL